jgi:hypothetical protein
MGEGGGGEGRKRCFNKVYNVCVHVHERYTLWLSPLSTFKSASLSCSKPFCTGKSQISHLWYEGNGSKLLTLSIDFSWEKCEVHWTSGLAAPHSPSTKPRRAIFFPPDWPLTVRVDVTTPYLVVDTPLLLWFSRCHLGAIRGTRCWSEVKQWPLQTAQISSWRDLNCKEKSIDIKALIILIGCVCVSLSLPPSLYSNWMNLRDANSGKVLWQSNDDLWVPVNLREICRPIN